MEMKHTNLFFQWLRDTANLFVMYFAIGLCAIPAVAVIYLCIEIFHLDTSFSIVIGFFLTLVLAYFVRKFIKKHLIEITGSVPNIVENKYDADLVFYFDSPTSSFPKIATAGVAVAVFCLSHTNNEFRVIDNDSKSYIVTNSFQITQV